ncbi:MAG: uroporphyrinogen decarboxylase family protein [Bacteroidales bacterium]|nr:uroporphyrinogen decarboxylase family protein [Bacteroidales bacterium]
MDSKNQLVSYIALGAPATRRPVFEVLPFLRPEIGFTPKWFHNALDIDFGEKWHIDINYRKKSLLKMREEIDRRFPGNRIGVIDQERSLDLLTGLHGACTVAAIYGVPIRYEADKWPTSEHFSLPEEEMNKLVSPDLNKNRFYQSILEQVDSIARSEGKVLGFINWQGVLNNGQRLRGEELFIDMFTNPEGTKNLLGCITNTMIEAAAGLQKIQAETSVKYNFFTISNCLVNMLSPELYDEFILPFDKKIAESFSTIGIHNCAWNANPYLESYSSIPRVVYIDMGIESDLEKARNLFPTSRRAIMYTPMDVANKSIDEIREDLTKIAENYGPCDIVAADIEDGTPDKKILDLIVLCDEISDFYENK